MGHLKYGHMYVYAYQSAHIIKSLTNDQSLTKYQIIVAQLQSMKVLTTTMGTFAT